MRTKHDFSPKRVRKLCLIGILYLIYSGFLAVVSHFTLDMVCILIFLNLIFLPLLFTAIEIGRVNERIALHKMSDFGPLARGIAISAALYVVYYFLPAYFAPVLIPVILLSCVSSELIGITSGIYFNTLLCLASGSGFYEYSAYTILTLCGGILVWVLGTKKARIYVNIMILSISVVIPCIFYYVSSFDMNYTMYLYALADGVITVIFVTVGFDKLYFYAKHEKQRNLTEIIADTYPLVQEIRNYSKIDYNHARKVSGIAYQCAGQIGADELTVAAAGFYYRIGKLEGEPFVENGISLAKLNCFPEEVISILSEYNGEAEHISSIESALVHMVDTLVTKFELLDRDTLQSTWNHDIVIYQTLNEKSAAGIYDESGLGMNQFLKIREFLVKGVDLF